jgi:hypothetical protein
LGDVERFILQQGALGEHLLYVGHILSGQSSPPVRRHMAKLSPEIEMYTAVPIQSPLGQ